MSYYGSWKIDDLLTFTANTHDPSTGGASDADAVPYYRVYEDETATPIITGSMALLDGSNTTGFYSEQITLSAANGFEKGKAYNIYIQASVGGVLGSISHNLQIEAEVDANTVSDSQMSQVASDTAVIEGWGLGSVASDTAAIEVDTGNIYSDTTIIASDVVIIVSDTTAIHSDTTIIASDVVQVYSDTTIIASDVVQVYSDTTIATSDTAVIEGWGLGSVASDAAAIESELILVHSETTVIQSDTAAIETDTGNIYSDTTIIASDVVQIYSDTTIIASDVVIVVSDTTAIHSDTTIIASDVVQIYSDTTIATSDTAAIETTVSGLNDLSAAQVNAEVVDVLRTDTVAELGSVPAASPSLHTMIQWIYMKIRNKETSTASAATIANDAGTAIGTSTLSDDGSTFTKSEYS